MATETRITRADWINSIRTQKALGVECNNEPTNAFMTAFICYHETCGHPVFRISREDRTDRDHVVEVLKGLLDKRGLPLLYSSENQRSDAGIEHAFWASSECFVGLYAENNSDLANSYVEVTVCVLDAAVLQSHFMELFCDQTWYKAIEKPGLVSVLCSSQHGLCVRTLGRVGTPFETSNYPVSVIDQFLRIQSDLKDTSPNGRLVLLSGPTGCGKTFFIRGLVESVSAKWIYIPSNLIEHVGEPQFLTALLDELGDAKSRERTILVVEDADTCLVHRQADNVSSISSLLNLTDGIIGELMDVQVIATTNVGLKEIDPALIRPGRLLSRVEMKLLEPRHADHVYRRELARELEADPEDQERRYTKKVSLAQVYSDARESALAITVSDIENED